MKTKYPIFVKNLFKPFLSLKAKVMKSIRLELILLFGVCLLASILIGSITLNILQSNRKHLSVDYNKSIEKVSQELITVANDINEKDISITDKAKLQQIINGYKYSESDKMLICDLNGTVICKSNNTSETKIDIYDTIKNSIENKISLLENNEYITEYRSFYPLKFIDGNGYIIITGNLDGKMVYEHDFDATLPSVIVGFFSFLIIFYFATKKKMKYIEFVSAGLLEISKGDLNYRIKPDGEDELALLANNINHMAEELKTKIDSERNAEKTKNELITNVSHDLRTPLTSIKGYLHLIKNKKYSDEKQLDQFVNISYNKAEKLELLINDLFEYTKLTNNAVNFSLQNISLNELLDQLIEELVPICEDNGVSISKDFIKEKVIVTIDPNKTVQVFENLLINAIRYGHKSSAIKVILAKENASALISIQNKCEPISDEDLDKIFDRFYRVEKSRSSDTGGSGLGLAIAKNMVELQGGTIEASYKNGYISFNVHFKISHEF